MPQVSAMCARSLHKASAAVDLDHAQNNGWDLWQLLRATWCAPKEAEKTLHDYSITKCKPCLGVEF